MKGRLEADAEEEREKVRQYAVEVLKLEKTAQDAEHRAALTEERSRLAVETNQRFEQSASTALEARRRAELRSFEVELRHKSERELQETSSRWARTQFSTVEGAAAKVRSGWLDVKDALIAHSAAVQASTEQSVESANTARELSVRRYL